MRNLTLLRLLLRLLLKTSDHCSNVVIFAYEKEIQIQLYNLYRARKYINIFTM